MSQLLPKKNLVVIVDRSRCDPADFVDITRRARAQAPDIRVQLLMPRTLDKLAPETWDHPTLVVSQVRLPNLRIKRGKLMMPSPIPKLRQAEMMQAAGVATPHVEPYRFGMTFDQSLWGTHVILKPSDLDFSSKGAGLEVIATKELSEKSEQDFPLDHFARSHQMLVQKFIDTGTHPVLYRAMTFLGEVLTIYRVIYVRHKPEGSTHVPTDFHSKSTEATRDFNHYPHVHAFARKTAAAFANWPLLGCDILEEHGTGKLYALEVNAGGNVWHFSSPYNAKQRAANPQYNAPRLNQYGAFDVAAKALINATRRLAV
jgi:hypothetical protein